MTLPVAPLCLAVFCVPSLLAQTTLNLSQDLVRLGIASTNMTPNRQSQDAAPLFAQGLTYAYSHQISKLIADPGAYYFLSKPNRCYATIGFSTFSNLTVDLQGSDLYFADLSATGLCVYGANITLQNFTIDYLKLPYTQLLVTSVNAAQRQIQFTVQPGWQKPSALNPLLIPGSIPTVYFFRHGQPTPFYDRMFVEQPLADDQLTFVNLLTSSSTILAQVRQGDIAVLFPANNYTSSIGGGNRAAGPNKAWTLRNIKIYAGGEAPLDLLGESLLLERVYIMPRPGTDRLISGGGPSIALTGPNNTLRLNRAIRTVDEAFTTGVPFYGSVQSVLGARRLQVQGGAAGLSSAHDTLANGRSMPNGSPVEFQRLSDGVVLGSATVVSQSATPSINGLTQVILDFDRDLPGNLAGAYLYPTDPNQRGGNTVVERNAVEHGGYCVGFDSYGLMNSTFRGNYVHHSTWAGIWINGNTMTSFEATPPPRNITVSGNVIDRPNSELGTVDFSRIFTFAGIQALELVQSSPQVQAVPAMTSPLQNITIQNNFIADPRRSAVWMGNTTGGSVSGN
jgi:hypothetical protein